MNFLKPPPGGFFVSTPSLAPAGLFYLEEIMKLEIRDGNLILSPTTIDDERTIFALAAAHHAFRHVQWPAIGLGPRSKAACDAELERARQNQEKAK